MLGDVALAGEGVGRGAVILDTDVPRVRALYLDMASLRHGITSSLTKMIHELHEIANTKQWSK